MSVVLLDGTVRDAAVATVATVKATEAVAAVEATIATTEAIAIVASDLGRADAVASDLLWAVGDSAVARTAIATVSGTTVATIAGTTVALGGTVAAIAVATVDGLLDGERSWARLQVHSLVRVRARWPLNGVGC